MAAPVVSVVVPARNEAGNLPRLIDGIEAACVPLRPFELIIVDDDSTDNSLELLGDLCKTRPWLRVLQNTRNAGQSASVHNGVLAARAPLVCTLDGDGQNPPSEIPKLVTPLINGPPELALVAGQRVGRQDTASKRWASKLANGVRNWALKDGTRDSGCGLKAFRRDAFLGLGFFNHMHRYLPALFRRDGWQITHVDVAHEARGAGRSNYNNLQRGFVGLIDLAGMMWLIRRKKQARATEVPRAEEP